LVARTAIRSTVGGDGRKDQELVGTEQFIKTGAPSYGNVVGERTAMVGGGKYTTKEKEFPL